MIAIGTWGLLRDSVNMSLQAAPPDLDPEEIGTFLRGRQGVQEIHDLHVWPMSTTETALTVHLLVPGGYPGDAYTAGVAAALKEKVRDRSRDDSDRDRPGNAVRARIRQDRLRAWRHAGT